MKKAVVVTSILVLALASVGLAQPRRGGDCSQGHGGKGKGQHHKMGFGQRGGGMHAGMGIQMILRHGDALKLTDQQEEKLEGMIGDFQIERIDVEANLKKAQVELHELMRNEAPESDVMAGIDRVTKLRGDMQKMQYRHHQQAKAVLTDAQVEQLEDLREERGRRWFKGWDDNDDDDDDSRGPGNGQRGGRG